MNGNSVPKRKKNPNPSALKRTQSQDLLNKPTKRKPTLKKEAEAPSPKFNQPQSKSMIKLAKSTKKKKQNNSNSKICMKKTVKLKENGECLEGWGKTVKKFGKKRKDKDREKDQQGEKEKEEELTQRKKIHLEYFMYKEVYVPIENTEQRKIIYKIQLIDQKVERKPKQLQQKPRNEQSQETKAQAVNKQIKRIDTGIQKSDRRVQISDFECQTQTSNQAETQATTIQRKPFQVNQQQEPEKCFAETLSQLQFLYLPDEKNFQNFTKSQKAHYKQLLLYIAKKFDEPQQKILDEQSVQILLQQRFLKQRGISESYPKKGIPTHTPSIISYVSNLFCYLEIHEKSNFIDRVNCSYGYSIGDRLKRVRDEKSTKMPTQFISESTFWRFQRELHQGLEFQSETIEKALHFHNRAVFDAVNQALLQFQPYFSSQGQPFPWSNNFQTTFYCISQSSYSALVCQIKDKIWQQSTTLAGLLLDTDPPSKQTYKTHYNRILAIEQQLMKSEVKKYNDKVEIDETRTRVLEEICGFVEMEVLREVAGLLVGLAG